MHLPFIAPIALPSVNYWDLMPIIETILRANRDEAHANEA